MPAPGTDRRRGPDGARRWAGRRGVVVNVLPLFAGAPAAARLSDPVAAHVADRAVTRSGVRGQQAEAVYTLVARQPGATAGELAAASGGRLDSVQVTRRLNDLERAGRVAKGPSRRCRAHGRRMTTWRPA